MWILPLVGYLGMGLGFGFLTLAIGISFFFNTKLEYSLNIFLNSIWALLSFRISGGTHRHSQTPLNPPNIHRNRDPNSAMAP